MSKTRIGVCDDNATLSKGIAEIVKSAFSAHKISHTVEAFTDGQALLAQHRLEPFDVLFLDIDMPKIGGFDIAKTLRQDFSRCLIVFVTSHAELVFESLDFQPFNFIRKTSGVPLNESIPQIVNKLICHLKQDEKIIIVDCLQKKHSVYVRDIVYIESSGHYVIYCVQKEGQLVKIKTRAKLSECQDLLEQYSFARIHKSYLVNLRHITHFNNSLKEIELMQKITLPLSKFYKQDADEKYSQFLRSSI